MSYLILARKFRPQTFDEVVGQEHITTTLQNAIKQDRVAQSFLFSGGRGIGKTSTARILAKALNCEKGPTTTPCGKCVACDEITRGISLDVLEIDGASNRGIDEIRNLRENVKFKPAHGRFKIYIIDEVHMLTGEAFNALLKTLEEPPPHVKFIFATTEPHKVPLTILSRCQRFHFKRISTKRIVEKLKEVAKTEKIKAEEKVLFLIARTAEGSLRDAESLLEQIASFSGGKLDEKKTLFVIGATDEKTYRDIISAIAERDVARSLQFIQKVADEGKDLSQFTKGLMEYFRNLLVAQAVAKPEELIDLDDDSINALKAQRECFTKEELLYALDVFQNVYSRMRRSTMPRIYLETGIVKVATREPMSSLAEVLDKIGQLERRLQSGEPDSEPHNSASQRLSSTARASAIEPVNRNTTKPAATTSGDKSVSKKLDNPPTQNLAPAAENSSAPSVASDSPQRQVTIVEVERHWQDAISKVEKHKKSVGVFLAEAGPLDVEGNKIILGMPSEFRFHKESLEANQNRRIVEGAFSDIFQTPLKVEYVITEAEREVKPTLEPSAEDEKSVPGIVEAAVEMFKGRVVRKK